MDATYRCILLILVISAVSSSHSVERRSVSGKAAKYVADFIGGASDMWRNFK